MYMWWKHFCFPCNNVGNQWNIYSQRHSKRRFLDISSIIYLFIYLALPTRAGSPQQHMPITVGPFCLTHPVNFPCGRKPEYPEETHDFRQSVDFYSFHMRTGFESHWESSHWDLNLRPQRWKASALTTWPPKPLNNVSYFAMQASIVYSFIFSSVFLAQGVVAI
jgi:hypothetical protein